MRRITLAAALVLVPLAAMAADPGGEFQVSSDSASAQYHPDAAMARDGSFLVAWGTSDAVYARLFSPGGAPRGSQFEVGSNGGHYLFSIHASADPDGFSVVWENYNKRFASSIGFRRLGLGGSPRRPAIVVSEEASPDVATNRQGGSVVVSQDGTRLTARWFDRSGTLLGRAPQLIASGASGPAVVRGREDSFLVAWHTVDGVFGRLLSASGARGAVFKVAPDNAPSPPSLASDPAGRFAVAWSSTRGVRLRLYSPSGVPRTGAIRVTEAADAGGPASPISVAMDAEGRILVVWTACPEVFNSCHVRGRRYGSTGVPAGGSFRISAGPADFEPEAAGGPSGRFVVVWRKFIADPTFPSSVIFGRRVGWAIDGDAPCVRQGNRFLCDAAHDGGEEEIAVAFGRAGDRALLGDIDGDGDDDPCLFKNGRFLCDTAHDGGLAEVRIPFGQDGDQPLLADLDGEGRDDPCVRRGDLLLCDSAHNGGTAELVVPFGAEEDVFLMGDIDGDGDDDPCVARSTSLLCDTEHDGGAAEVVLPFAVHHDVALLGDVDADGDDDPCVHRDGRFLCDTRHEGDFDVVIPFGEAGDIALMGDLDGP